MYSDVVSSCLNTILKRTKPTYAVDSTYPRIVVINMISAMLLTMYVSNYAHPLQPGFIKDLTLADLKRMAFETATVMYDERMKVCEICSAPLSEPCDPSCDCTECLRNRPCECGRTECDVVGGTCEWMLAEYSRGQN